MKLVIESERDGDTDTPIRGRYILIQSADNGMIEAIHTGTSREINKIATQLYGKTFAQINTN